MQLPEAIKLMERQIRTGARHADYDKTVDLAETYLIYITGDNIAKKLIQFSQREELALFEQRIRLTRSITPAVASSIRQPFNKVIRNDRIRKSFTIKDAKSREEAVAKMMVKFYGAARKKNRGLEYWLKTRFIELQFSDPNAWVVVEWDTPANESEIIAPRPFEVSAKQAVNFFVVNDEVKWLLVCQDIKYLSIGGSAEAATLPGTPLGGTAEPQRKDGNRYTLYDEEVTVVFEQVDRAYQASQNYQLQPGEEWIKVKDIDYLVRTFTPNVGYVPAFRIGYKRDEATHGRTFVNPWHDALCYFEKSLKTVSELDLTMTLHTFPQKLQYVQKCQGVPALNGTARKACNKGYEQGSTTKFCESCKGTGYKIHTTAQDAILLPMPDTKEEMIPLDNILVYKSPPIELIKFQNDYTQQLERQAHQAVFNSQTFVKKNGGGITEGDTATETEYNMQSVYDALEPLTEKLSEMWRELVTIFGIIAGGKLDDIETVHEFPADYKLKTEDVLLSERQAATEAGAPAFFIETLDDDLAAIKYAGDQLGLLKYKVKRKFYPFSGKNPDEVALLMASEFVPEEVKILYANFDLIFKEIENENPAFWNLTTTAAQKDILTAKVEQWQENLKAQRPAMTFDIFRSGSQSGQDGNQGQEGNPGEQGAAA